MIPFNARIYITPCLLLLAGLPGCGDPSPAEVTIEAERLRASFHPHQRRYLDSIETVNRLIPQSLAWLNGAAITAPRAQAIADAHMIMERWAQVHFVPRTMHEKLRSDRYRTRQVRDAHRRLLDHLKRNYFEWHDYQRYAQNAAESSMHNTPSGRLPPELEEFRRRLEARPPVDDRISPLLNELPRFLPAKTTNPHSVIHFSFLCPIPSPRGLSPSTTHPHPWLIHLRDCPRPFARAWAPAERHSGTPFGDGVL